eukprot:gene12379-8858_t
MNNLNPSQAYKLSAVLVLGGIAGIVFFGNKTPQKNLFDRTGPPPKFVPKPVAGEDEEEDLKRHLADIDLSKLKKK